MLTERAGAVAIAAMFAVAAIAPPLAGATARTEKYSGPIDLPVLPGALQGQASIDLTIKSKSKKGKKPKPKFVSRLKTHSVYVTCPDGTHLFPADNNSEFDPTYGFEFEGAKIKKRKFSTTDSLTGITLAGRVPKKGPASGTIGIQLDSDNFGHCDTGGLSWTAEKL